MTSTNLEGIFYFYIENKVTDVGLRLDIAKDIPDELEIRVDNITKNKVRVYLRGKEQAVERFYKYIKKKKKIGKAENYSISELKLMEEAGCINIDTNRFFHKLECEQMGKFVDVGIEMREEITAMKEEIQKLPKNLAKELKKVLT
ncbi:MAG: hypothetical protein JW778_06955 [Candidatus Altiarchaeota archaeon]|nr:hypothetical protein [Candidatus Altiarchaeota archaeon]